MTDAKLIEKDTWQIEDGFVRFFLLAGNKKALLIDSGVSHPDTHLIAANLTGVPINLLNTHGDGDHISDNKSYPVFYMHYKDYVNCEIASKVSNSRLIPICDGDTIDLGDRVVDILEIPGHTEGSIAVYDRMTKILFSGDSVQNGNIYMFGQHRNPNAFRASLEKLAGLQDIITMICPSHGDSPLSPDYTEHIIEAVDMVNRGEVQPETANVNGKEVKWYKTKWCGFYTAPSFERF